MHKAIKKKVKSKKVPYQILHILSVIKTGILLQRPSMQREQAYDQEVCHGRQKLFVAN